MRLLCEERRPRYEMIMENRNVQRHRRNAVLGSMFGCVGSHVGAATMECRSAVHHR
jgi:hypothetical protein